MSESIKEHLEGKGWLFHLETSDCDGAQCIHSRDAT